MRRIEQQDDNGCDAAGAAMLAGVTYRRASDRMHPDGRGGRCSSAELIRQTLRQHHGVTLGKKQKLAGKKFSDLTVDALIEATCRWHGSAPWGH